MAEKTPNKRPVRPKQKKTPEKPKKGSGFWIGLICFSSIWMFALGIFVGRGTAPVQFDIRKIQDDLAALKQAVVKKEKEQFDDLSKTVNKKGHLEFYEALKKEEPVTAAAGVRKSPGVKKPKADKPAAIIETPVKPEKKQPVKRVQPPTVKPEKPAPAVRTAEGDYRWTIQVSSLKDQAAADNMVLELKGKGYSAYRMDSSVSGKGKWHRVRVGPFRHKEEAQKTLSRLKSQKFDAILITL
jgi:DedD protein